MNIKTPIGTKISAIIFDMDGLLINSEPLWVQAEIHAFGEVGITLNETFCAQTMGLRVDDVVRYWYEKKPWNHLSLKSVEKNIIHNVTTLIKSQGKSCEGVDYILDFFNQKKIPMALASSSSMDIIDAALSKLHIKSYFDSIVSAENEPYGKPHPGVFISTANKLGINPERCLVFEDSINGVIAGKAAKMKVIAVPENKLLTDPGFHIADMIIPSLKKFNSSLLHKV